ncbi:MAG: Crp/Fnr family transcriptional regulator [Chitinophagales bacterium]|nr:Crp/Fnr family transcriptional regulator [Chitinophagales bacterium]
MKEIVALSTKTIIIERNGFVKQAGSVDTNIYFIQSGSVKIYVINDNDEQIIRLGYKGSLIASLDSFFTQKPSIFFIQALKKSVIKVITSAQLNSFLREGNNGLLWNAILEDLVLQQIEREIDLLTSSPKERFQRVLKRSPQLFQEIPNRYIANYLRMSAETLSRLKSLDFNQDL